MIKTSSPSLKRGVMLQLFQSIFGKDPQDEPYPDELISRAVERAVDGTDPRLRVLPGYRKKLRPAVIHAINHVVALVDRLPAPLKLSRTGFSSDPESTAYFVSMDHVREILALDPELNQWRRSPGDAVSDHIVMLLLMERQDRKVLGIELDGSILRRDVPQTTVSFADHRLVDPAASEGETRRQLKRRAFDHLLALALGRMVAAQDERAGLERERNLLRRKSKTLAAGGWGFGEADRGVTPDPAALQRQIEAIESQINALGAGPELLKANIDLVVDVLSQAEDNFWVDSSPLIIDRMGVQQARASALVPEIRLTVLHNAAGRSLVARLLRIARADLPPQRDLVREAQRYLG